MAIPPDAVLLPQVRDPSDIKPAYLSFAVALLPGEAIASYEIVLSAASVAAGMTISNSGGRQPSLVDSDTVIKIWPLMDAGEADDVSFDGTGVTLDGKVTVVSDSVPSTTVQKTFLINWAQQ